MGPVWRRKSDGGPTCTIEATLTDVLVPHSTVLQNPYTWTSSIKFSLPVSQLRKNCQSKGCQFLPYTRALNKICQGKTWSCMEKEILRCTWILQNLSVQINHFIILHCVTLSSCRILFNFWTILTCEISWTSLTAVQSKQNKDRQMAFWH